MFIMVLGSDMFIMVLGSDICLLWCWDPICLLWCRDPICLLWCRDPISKHISNPDVAPFCHFDLPCVVALLIALLIAVGVLQGIVWRCGPGERATRTPTLALARCHLRRRTCLLYRSGQWPALPHFRVDKGECSVR